MKLNFEAFPRRGYVPDATPVEPLQNLSAEFKEQDVTIYCKRDDLLPGASGGNKTRKLDFCLADALEQGADTIVTCGAVQSNHCRLTAAWCCKERLDCHLILEERIKGSYKSTASGNNFLFQLLGVDNISVVPGGTDMMAAMEVMADKLRQQGKKPYIIPGGASNPIGALGYASCAQELVEQLEENKEFGEIEHVVLASGSGGTHAGMSLLPLLRPSLKVYGICTSKKKEEQEAKIHKLAQETADLLDIGEVPAPQCWDEYVGPGYSLPTPEMVEAVKLFAQTEGILLDPVYTGKAAAGLIGLIRQGTFPPGSKILFLHTGGSPALYAYLDTFR